MKDDLDKVLVEFESNFITALFSLQVHFKSSINPKVHYFVPIPNRMR